jgi:hypothetical protein
MVSIPQTKMLCANIPHNLSKIRPLSKIFLIMFGKPAICIIKEW